MAGAAFGVSPRDP